MLSTKELEEHHIALRIACDPQSPFYGMVQFNDLLALPLRDQNQVWDTMNLSLKEMVSTVIREKMKV
jgi:hypothetical protein